MTFFNCEENSKFHREVPKLSGDALVGIQFPSGWATATDSPKKPCQFNSINLTSKVSSNADTLFALAIYLANICCESKIYEPNQIKAV